MNYTKKSFTVTQPGTKTYAENWEKTFRSSPYEIESTGQVLLPEAPVPEAYEDATGERRYWPVNQPRRIYFPPR
jgi:hypothetical protein